MFDIEGADERASSADVVAIIADALIAKFGDNARLVAERQAQGSLDGQRATWEAVLALLPS